jgi:nucleotide-binding universal stress UspA family protein
MSIIVGFVPTASGQAALTAGIAEAKLRSEDLVIVNSSKEGAVVDKSLAPDEVLEAAARRATEADVRASILQPRYRNAPADEVLGIARSASASLIVIGLHDRAQEGVFNPGSDAQRILLQADRPVLAVKAEELPARLHGT